MLKYVVTWCVILVVAAGIEGSLAAEQEKDGAEQDYSYTTPYTVESTTQDSYTTRYPQSSTTRYPQPSTTRYPQPSTTRYPQSSTTRYPQPSTTRYPQPSTTRYPQSTTQDSYTTRYPQSSTTRYPQPSTTEYPLSSTTRYPQSTTTSGWYTTWYPQTDTTSGWYTTRYPQTDTTSGWYTTRYPQTDTTSGWYTTRYPQTDTTTSGWYTTASTTPEATYPSVGSTTEELSTPDWTTTESPSHPSPEKLILLALRGYEYIEGFGFYKVNDISRSWLSAKRYCEKQGSHLAIINSEDEAINLKALMQQNGGSGYYWMGGNDLEEEGNYLTIFGNSLENTGYTSWFPGDPNGDINQNCLAFYYGNETLSGYVDESCTANHWTVCELESDIGLW